VFFLYSWRRTNNEMVYAPRVERYKGSIPEPGYFSPSTPPVRDLDGCRVATDWQVVLGYFRWIWPTFKEYWQEISFNSEQVLERDEM
jgi:hypothetical protein